MSRAGFFTVYGASSRKEKTMNRRPILWMLAVIGLVVFCSGPVMAGAVPPGQPEEPEQLGLTVNRVWVTDRVGNEVERFKPGQYVTYHVKFTATGLRQWKVSSYEVTARGVAKGPMTPRYRQTDTVWKTKLPKRSRRVSPGSSDEITWTEKIGTSATYGSSATLKLKLEMPYKYINEGKKVRGKWRNRTKRYEISPPIEPVIVEKALEIPPASVFIDKFWVSNPKGKASEKFEPCNNIRYNVKIEVYGPNYTYGVRFDGKAIKGIIDKYGTVDWKSKWSYNTGKRLFAAGTYTFGWTKKIPGDLAEAEEGFEAAAVIEATLFDGFGLPSGGGRGGCGKSVPPDFYNNPKYKRNTTSAQTSLSIQGQEGYCPDPIEKFYGAQSHAIHMDDPKGPKLGLLGEDDNGDRLGCLVCHDMDSDDEPGFADNAGFPDTTVCDACHSPGGLFDGSKLAKANWKFAVYKAKSNKIKKDTTVEEYIAKNRDEGLPSVDNWCDGCHDGGSSVINDVAALNVIGDDYKQYGYYIGGHGRPRKPDPKYTRYSYYMLSFNPAGLKCESCHDLTDPHIDGNAKTYSAAQGNYTAAYRLTKHTKKGLTVPRVTLGEIKPKGKGGQFGLCRYCHNKYLFPSSSGFRDEPPTRLLHTIALGSEDMVSTPAWDSDSDGEPDSGVTCTTCHDVHGPPMILWGGNNPNPVMIRSDFNFRWYAPNGDPTEMRKISQGGELDATPSCSINVAGCHQLPSIEYSRDKASVHIEDVWVEKRNPRRYWSYKRVDEVSPGEKVRFSMKFTVFGPNILPLVTADGVLTLWQQKKSGYTWKKVGRRWKRVYKSGSPPTETEIPLGVIGAGGLRPRGGYAGWYIEPLSSGRTYVWTWQRDVPIDAMVGKDGKVVIKLKMGTQEAQGETTFSVVSR